MSSYPLQYFRFGMSNKNNCVAASVSSIIPTHDLGRESKKLYLNYIDRGSSK